ncbi:MAG: hypothetical protein GY811_30180 [Myxococcales bacterium]|nr:hypothetical protein [Myxococcales bacterium]
MSALALSFQTPAKATFFGPSHDMSLLRNLMLASCLAFVALPAAAAQAEELSPTATKTGSSADFWGVDASQTAAFEARMTRADSLALLATDYETREIRRAALAARAMSEYEEALKLDPKSSEAHFRAALVSLRFLTAENVPPSRELRRLIVHLVAFEELAPSDPRLTSLLFARSLARTKLIGQGGDSRDLERAIGDYDKHLALLDQSNSWVRNRMSTTLSNRAELLMMLGRLEEAITGYEEAIAIEASISYGYGLAVALDRDGQDFLARDVARTYALLDPSDALTQGGTFFVPQGEIHYYQALRAESIANYRTAKTAYEAFLVRLPRSRFAAKARKNLQAIRSKAASQPRPKPARTRIRSFPRPF